MRCKNTQVLMIRERTESLSSEQAQLLERHLETCAACRTEREEIAEFIPRLTGLKTDGQVYASRPDTTALLSRSQQSLRRETLSWRGLAFGALAVGAAVVVLAFMANRMTSGGSTDLRIAKGVQNKQPTSVATTSQNNAPHSLSLGKASGGGSRQIGQPTTEHRDLRVANGNPQLKPSDLGQGSKSAVGDDLSFLNAESGKSAANRNRWPSEELEKVVALLEKTVNGGDKFITVPALQLAGNSDTAIQTAAQAYLKEKAIVDARLVRKVNLTVKGASFAELCLQMTSETGIQVTANRKVADDKVTVFCKDRPLRDIMRQISSLFGFTWLRSGKEGEFEYELTQTLKSELLEEALREKDRNEMLLAIDRQMEGFRKYLGLSLPQIKELANKRLALGIQEKSAFDEYNTLHMLERGGLVAANMFFRLSANELDQLRNGQKLKWDLANSRDLRLPSAVVGGISDTFKDMITGAPKDVTRISAELELDTNKPGEYILKGGLYNQEGGMSATLAHAKSPSRDKKRIENAKENAALANDPSLQATISLRLKPSCTLVRPPYPDTDFAFAESAGPKVLTYDVLEAIHEKTGKDIIGDQFMRLHAPSEVSIENARMFDALNHVGDAMQIHWAKEEGWLKFRSPDYYYARPQEVPTHLFEHWAEERKNRGVLSIDQLAEIAQLTDAQLDSITTAQGAVACFGLEEWPIARQAQGRPHWRLLGQLSRQQREAAQSVQGLGFMSLGSALRRQYIKLSECADIGIWPSELEMRDAHLKLLYSPLAVPDSANAAASALLPGNAAVFLYSFGNPKRFSAIGPFNAIVGLSEPMLAEHLKRKPAVN